MASRDQQHDAVYCLPNAISSVFTRCDNNFHFLPQQQRRSQNSISLIRVTFCVRHLEMLQHKNRGFLFLVPCHDVPRSQKKKNFLVKKLRWMSLKINVDLQMVKIEVLIGICFLIFEVFQVSNQETSRKLEMLRADLKSKQSEISDIV